MDGDGDSEGHIVAKLEFGSLEPSLPLPAQRSDNYLCASMEMSHNDKVYYCSYEMDCLAFNWTQMGIGITNGCPTKIYSDYRPII